LRSWVCDRFASVDGFVNAIDNAFQLIQLRFFFFFVNVYKHYISKTRNFTWSVFFFSFSLCLPPFENDLHLLQRMSWLVFWFLFGWHFVWSILGR
jgi:hypothetical protein